jgi:hypothetical protein
MPPMRNIQRPNGGTPRPAPAEELPLTELEDAEQAGDFILRARPYKVLLLLIGAFQIYSALSVRFQSGARVLFSLLTFSTIVLVIITIRQARLSRRGMNVAIIWLVVASMFLLPVPTQPFQYFKFVIGDYVSTLFPLLLFFAGFGSPRMFTDVRSVRFLSGLLLIAAIVAPILGAEQHRYDPPSVVLLAAACIFFISAPTRRAKLFYAGLLLLLAFLALGSGYRTSIILWLAGLVLVLFIFHGPQRMLSMGLAAAVVIIVGGQLGVINFDLVSKLDETRFRTLANGQTDYSLQARVDEARDVVHMASTRWPAYQMLYGYGYGAHYQPEKSFIVRNVNGDGLVHNIHIGPALIYFRFGIAGLAIYLALIWVLIKELLYARQMKIRGKIDIVRTFFVIATMLYLLDDTVRNSFLEPTFAFVIAGFLFHHVTGLRATLMPRKGAAGDAATATAGGAAANEGQPALEAVPVGTRWAGPVLPTGITRRD